LIVVQEYVDAAGRNEYRDWFNRIDVQLAVRVTTIVERIAAGHKAALAPVGEGVSEYKNDIGPGLRIYFGKDGDQLVILLGGGTKRTQGNDIEAAKVLWREYKSRKKQAQKAEAETAAKKPTDRKKRK
jgi:putative addiction module killer protein